MNELLILENVNKKYPKFELKNVSFSIPKGSIVGFIGRNGAGKTTTLKGIMNLVHFDSGKVIVFDKDMKEDELEAKQNIGFSLSELNYYPNKTIKQIVSVTKRFYRNFNDETFNKLCNLFNLDLNKKLEALSSGMKVKYSLAVALSYDAKLLILDEPTSGLDPVSREEILDIFQSIVQNKERAILFSTHITSDLDKCASDIVYIHNGEIIYEGTKLNFINSYRILEGKEELLSDDLKEDCISYKVHDSVFEALIRSDIKVKNTSITIKEPDLEQIMVGIERGKGNEKFII